MKRFCLFISFTILILGLSSARSLEEIPNVHLSDSRRYVSDPEGLISRQEISRADAIIAEIREKTTVETVVVIVSPLDEDMNIDMAANELFDQWQLGDKDKENGLLILIDVGNRLSTIRTGRGLEGVLPDMVCDRLIEEYLVTPFKNGEYGVGIIDLLTNLDQYLSQPDILNEIKAEKSEGDDFLAFLTGYLLIALVVLLILIGIILYLYNTNKNSDRIIKYERLRKWQLPSLMISIAFLGIPIFSYFLVKSLMKRIRMQIPECPNCQHKMKLIDEIHDNDFLTPSQDREEQLNSIDYDVWVCDNCNATEIFPYVNKNTSYQTCPNCGARAELLESEMVIKQPTNNSEGIGQKQYYCHNCGNRRRTAYKIAKTVSAAPALIIGGLGAIAGRGGDGIHGGSFGGGSTGGGGATRGW